MNVQIHHYLKERSINIILSANIIFLFQQQQEGNKKGNKKARLLDQQSIHLPKEGR